MAEKLPQQVNVEIPPDVGDALEVFLYTNLSAIISPTPSVLLTANFQAGLQTALNDVGIRHNMGLSRDLKDILDVFIITDVNAIVINTTP